MAKLNKICFCCGKKYSYCPTCYPDMNKPSWYMMWCSEQCKDLDNILAKHTMGNITTEEAKKRIQKLKLKEISFANESIKNHYENIMNYKDEIVKPKTPRKKKEELDTAKSNTVTTKNSVNDENNEQE